MKKIIVLTTATALLSSCGIYTKYQPAETTPDNLYGEEVAVDDTTNFGNVNWRELFTDPQLQALIEQGLQNNTDLRSAQLQIEEAEAALMSAKLAFLPSFALSPQGTISSFDGGKATKTYTLPVTASWELDIFGRLRNAKQQAKALYAQSKDYQQAVRTQLIAGIANVYYTLLMLDEQLAISQQTEEAWKETVASTRALMDAGLANEAATSQMEAAYYSVQTSILDLKEQINQVENSLALLLAEIPRRYERGKLADQRLPEDVAVGVPMQMLSNRPDVRAAERSLEQAFYATNQARAAFYPQITLSGSAGWTNNSGAGIVNPGKLLASVVGSLTQPLFYRGQNIARLKAAKAQEEQAKLSFQQALLNAGSEVSNALSLYQKTSEKVESRQMQVESAKKASEDTKELFNLGTSTYLEVLSAQQSYLSAQISQVSDCFDRMQAVVSLYQALGGGREE